MEIVIDRFEGDYAVIELQNGEIVNVDKRLFDGFNEGDIISISKNEEKTNNRKEEINNLMDELFK